MKIYVVEEHVAYEGSYLINLFKNKQDAIDAMKNSAEDESIKGEIKEDLDFLGRWTCSLSCEYCTFSVTEYEVN